MPDQTGTHTAEQENESTKRLPLWKRLWKWSGFGKKTAWDWLQLLVVPLALAAIGFWFTMQQDVRQQAIENQRAQQAQEIEDQRAESERIVEEQRAQDDALQAYLDQMSTLLLEKNLRSSEVDSEVRMLARARTLSVLGRLDPRRRTETLRFLLEANLVRSVNGRNPVIELSEAELSGADLSDAELNGADLNEAQLSDVNLSEADLSNADLSNANLKEAVLIFAELSEADLSNANLNKTNQFNADLSDANLSNAELSDADLRGVNLSGANLRNAQLIRADLRDANLSDDDLL